MPILNIKKYPDKILRKRCRKVPSVDEGIKALLDDMALTMESENGLGLAAPQVGKSICAIVVNSGKGILKLVNPKIMERGGTSYLVEGCLSVPQRQIKVKRAQKVKVTALNEEGKRVEIEAEGLLAHVLQHEIDHLRGRLIIDYLPLYKRIFVR